MNVIEEFHSSSFVLLRQVISISTTDMITGSCKPTCEYEMLMVMQYCIFWKLYVTTIDECKQRVKKKVISS